MMKPISSAPFYWQSVLPFALFFYSYSPYPAYSFLHLTLLGICFFHAPFQYHKDDVLEIIAKQWNIQTRILLQLISIDEVTFSSMYLPFWTFDGTVQILCALGYRVSPVIYSPEEQVILKGEWPTQKSWFECDIDDVLIYAGRSASNDEIVSIFPFDLRSILEYRPEILAGWQAENYQIALEDAAIEAHKVMRDIAFKRATHRRLFMRASEMLQEDVLVMEKTYKLILLPVWIISLTRDGQVFQTLINGQTGKIFTRETRWSDIFD